MFPIGICTDFDHLLDVVELGYDFIELPLRALAALPESDFQEFVDYAESTGLKIAAVNALLPENLPITGDRVQAHDLHEYLSLAFGRARRLGVRTAVLDSEKSRSVPLGVDFPFAWRQLGNFLRLAQGHAKESGLTLAIEPLRAGDCNLLNLVSEATLIAGLLQLGNVAVAANSASMAMAAEPLSALRRAAPLLRHVHVEHPLSRRLPKSGDGEDYGRLLHTLAEIGYEGGVSVCAKNYGDYKADAEAALACMKMNY